MQTIGKLSTNLCRRWTFPMSLPLPPTSLRLRHALRARIPLVPYRTSSTTQSDSAQSDSAQSDSAQSDSAESDPEPTTRLGSGLAVTGNLKQFVASHPDFSLARMPGMAYFDKTKYIPILEDMGDDLLVCRPRRFGKSLTISMLKYFHGFEFRTQYDKLFKDLDVNKAVDEETILPGRYLVLAFDFLRVTRYPELDECAEEITGEINRGLQEFQREYAKDLGSTFEWNAADLDPNRPNANLANLVSAVDFTLKGIHQRWEEHHVGHPLLNVNGIYVLVDEYDAFANEYMDPENARAWSDTKPFHILKGFLANLKSGGTKKYGIRKSYITGVTPLVLSDIISGANHIHNISFDPDISTLCGLTQSNVKDALGVVCSGNGKEKKVDEHLNELTDYANGYHFCQEQKVEPVFNTTTAFSYLQSVGKGRDPLKNPSNSEVSEPFLRICTKSPAAVNTMQSVLLKDENGDYQKIPCQDVLLNFKLSDLAIQNEGEGDVSAWRSLMVYMGGLTPDSKEPSEFLKITNLVAARRFGEALISRVGATSTLQTSDRHLTSHLTNPLTRKLPAGPEGPCSNDDERDEGAAIRHSVLD